MPADWKVIRGTVVFYVLYLLTLIPIAWLPENQVASGILVASAVDAVIVIGYWIVSRTSLRAFLVPEKSALRFVGLSALLLLPLLLLNLGYHWLLTREFGAEVVRLTNVYEVAGYPLWVALLDLCLMPAIWEEIAFRGLIQGQLEKVLRPREALVTTAILFGIIHCSIVSGPYLFLLGLVLGVLRTRSRSLIPGMMLHFAHNLLVLLFEAWGWG